MDGQRPGREHEPEPQPDDLDIEGGDLRQPTLRPSDERSVLAPGKQGVVPWHRRSVTVPRQVVAAAVVALLVLVLLVVAPLGSVLDVLRSQSTLAPTTVRFVFPTPVPATPTPSRYPTPTVNVPALGPVPTDCPPGSPLVDFSSGDTYPGLGGLDVWLVAGNFVGPHGVAVEPHATAHLGSPRLSDYTPFGWPVQVQVLVRTSFAQRITLSGRDLRTGYALWLLTQHPFGASTLMPIPTLTFDLGQLQGFTSNGQWAIWFGVLYLPDAGCYTFQAMWPTGGWTVHFAAGR